jgi:DnaJ domain
MTNSLLILSLTLLIKKTIGFVQLPFAHREILYRFTATRNDVDEAEFERGRHRTPTLYDILGASPTASRSELKQHYIKLARATHPDALIGLNVTASDDMMNFTQIAQAWKVLSNDKERRKYDRSLVAEDFKESFAKAATNVVESAAPRVMKAFDEYAMPFLRRTTVTTVATVSAAVDVLGNGEALDLGSAVVTGMKAAKAAGKVIDSIEYLEKSRILEERYVGLI